MRSYCIIAIALLLTGIAATALADTDLSALDSGTASIRSELLGKLTTWNATADEVEAAQAETAEPETYQEAYDLLQQAKEEMEAYAERLNGSLADVFKYIEEHPDLSPAEQELTARLTDRVDSLSVLADSFLMRVGAIEAAQAALLEAAGVEEEAVEPELDSTGDISVLTGNGTYTDHDRIYVGLRQVYKDRQEQYFTFWEKYQNDHSFIDLEKWDVGMSQEDIELFNGELNLRERYRDYRDLNNARNNRHQLDLNLDYEYLFNNDMSVVDFSYDYRTKNFDMPLARSYLYHNVMLYAMHPLSDRVTADAFWKMTDYHYAQGDLRGYNRTELGAGLEFEPNEAWLWGAEYVSTEKSYDVLKANAYFEDEGKLWARYMPNNYSLGEAEIRYRDRDRRRGTVDDYNEWRLQLNYWREFTREFEGDFRFEWRDRDFSGVNPAEYDYWRWSMSFGYMPQWQTRWYYSFDYYDYGFNRAVRSYDRAYHRVGLNYTWDNGATATCEFSYTDQNYAVNPGRNYSIWGFLADVRYPFENGDDARAYIDWCTLDQSMANSPNEYNALSWGVEYNWKLSPHYRLTFGYDYDLRDYENQPRIKDQTFEARLRFDF